MAAYNFHPALVAFPLALLVIVFLLELGRFTRWRELCQRAAWVNLLFATLFVVLAFLSGYKASELAGELGAAAQAQLETHHGLGRLLMFAIFPACFLGWIRHRATHGRAFFEILYLLTLITCVSLVLLAGFNGGRLVFEHAVGVTAAQ